MAMNCIQVTFIKVVTIKYFYINPGDITHGKKKNRNL